MQRQPVNDYNFIRWYAASGETLPLASAPTAPGPRLDFPIYKNIDRCASYAPVFVPNEPISFFINSPTALPYDPSTLTLGLLRGATLVINDLGGLRGLEDINNPGSYYLYHDNLQITTVPESRYRLVLYSSDSTVEYFSNQLQCLSFDRAQLETVRLESSNTRNHFYYYYKEALDAGAPYQLRLRLHIYQDTFVPEMNFKQYRAANTGRLRNVKAEPDLSYQLITKAFDHDAHRAMIALSLQDTIAINGRYYLTKEDYTPNIRTEYPMSNGSWTVYEQAFSRITRYAGDVERLSDPNIRETSGQENIRVISDPN